MSKQIHKDNKILPIMNLSILELTKKSSENETLNDLHYQLKILMEERYSLIKTQGKFQKYCKYSSTNAVIQYYFNKSQKESKNF